MDITKITDPSFLKGMSIKELESLARDIRVFLLQTISQTGGHLSSNLGVVELTIAMHYVFDAPKDKIIFDVGHQCYTHKILTGRASKMDTLRQYNGLSGFQKRCESEYDPYEAGHSSTALSAGLGFACARDLNKENYNVISVVGDGAIASGMSLEALNQIGYLKKKMIIIFNDNNMSISKNVGSLTKGFSKLRNSKSYNNLKDNIKDTLKQLKNGEKVVTSIHNFKDAVKKKVVNAGLFDDFDIEYLGPIDGHNFKDLIRAFEVAKNAEEPVVIHVVTKKGKGYEFTENDTQGIWHGVGRFDIATGKMLSSVPEGYKSYSQLVADEVEELMDTNKDIVTITPAMLSGSALGSIFAHYPQRSFDCGIAEDHAVTFACGLASNNKRPFVSIYSSFLQRAYDQLNHDVCRMNLPVVFGIDRAGLVGADGETHHGVFDISILRSLPNMVIAQGRNSKEIGDLIYTAFNQKHPFAIRYPRGCIKYEKNEKKSFIEVGKWEITANNNIDTSKAIVLTYGADVDTITQRVNQNELAYTVVNCRYIKPIDSMLMMELSKHKLPIYVYTTDILKGGLSDEILECLNKNHIDCPIKVIGIDDVYVKHGLDCKLKKDLNIDIDYLFEIIEKEINA